MEIADIIIVGAGSAGCVLANRLTEDGKTRVILIEAGGKADSLIVQMPVGFAKMLLKEQYDWQYQQRPDVSINGRNFVWSAGKMLGGSSSINGQVWIRGTRRDFDNWVELGATGWGYDDVLPYFMRCESWQGAASQSRGSHGPITIDAMRDPHPLCAAFLAGCSEFGLDLPADYNAGSMEGAFLTQTNQRNGWRCSTEKAYLRPARGRRNLHIMTGAAVRDILVENGRAVGVRIVRDGVEQVLRAQREVIVSAGALGSPALLMRSGIGPAGHLRDKGIAVLHDLPAVGQNLQEHSGAAQNKYVNRPTINSELGPVAMALNLAKFFWNRTGHLSAPAVQAMALIRSREDLDEPDAQLHFMPLAYDIGHDSVSAASAVMPNRPCITVSATLTRQWSRGQVLLGEAGEPVADHQMLRDPRDCDALVSALKAVDRLFRTPSFAALITSDRTPDPVPDNDAEWADYARAKTNIAYHPVGTCRMGSDARSVVDTSCRVRGIAALRVVDASIMPRITSGNTNATTVMVAEKISEAIRMGA